MLLTLGVSATAMAQDSDNDTVADSADYFPCDPTLSAVAWAPGDRVEGTVMFEDNWPAQGDLDFNDVVVGYNYVLKSHLGTVRKMTIYYDVIAVGGTLDSGLALKLPVARTSVASITRSINGATATNITPNNDTQLTMVVSNNLRDVLGGTAGPINAKPDRPRKNGARIVLEIVFATPVTLGTAPAPYDLFIFRTNDATHEIHRPEYSGSIRMNTALFNTVDDASTPSRKFIDHSGLPFALVTPDLVDYPGEEVEISTMMPKIIDFAGSGGVNGRDFYSNGVVPAKRFRDSAGQGRWVPAPIPPIVVDLDCTRHDPFVDAKTLEVITVAGTLGASGLTNGNGASARFNVPAAIGTDGTTIFVAERGRIRTYNPATGDVGFLAGDGGGPISTEPSVNVTPTFTTNPTQSRFGYIRQVKADAGYVYTLEESYVGTSGSNYRRWIRVIDRATGASYMHTDFGTATSPNLVAGFDVGHGRLYYSIKSNSYATIFYVNTGLNPGFATQFFKWNNSSDTAGGVMVDGDDVLAGIGVGFYRINSSGAATREMYNGGAQVVTEDGYWVRNQNAIVRLDRLFPYNAASDAGHVITTVGGETRNPAGGISLDHVPSIRDGIGLQATIGRGNNITMVMVGGAFYFTENYGHVIRKAIPAPNETFEQLEHEKTTLSVEGRVVTPTFTGSVCYTCDDIVFADGNLYAMQTTYSSPYEIRIFKVDPDTYASTLWSRLTIGSGESGTGLHSDGHYLYVTTQDSSASGEVYRIALSTGIWTNMGNNPNGRDVVFGEGRIFFGTDSSAYPFRSMRPFETQSQGFQMKSADGNAWSGADGHFAITAGRLYEKSSGSIAYAPITAGGTLGARIAVMSAGSSTGFAATGTKLWLAGNSGGLYSLAVNSTTLVPIAGQPSTSGTTDGTGSQARFTDIRRIAPDTGSLWIIDNGRLRRVF